MAHFGQNWPKFRLILAKMSKNWGFWFWQFLCEKNGWKLRDPMRQLVFCVKPSHWSWWFRSFDKNLKITHFGQNWFKFGHIWLYLAWSTGVQNHFVKNFETRCYYLSFSKSKKNYFRSTNPHFTLSPDLENF